MKTRRAFRDAAGWVGCAVVLATVWAGLDGYRRVPLSYGYAPERRAFFAATLAAAGELDRGATLDLVPEDRWFLLNGWQQNHMTVQAPRALAQQRRAQLIVPIFTPSEVLLTLDVTALPPPGVSDWVLELEVGIEGKRLERFSVPGRQHIEVTVPASEVIRGDNIIYLYRVTRRSDPGAWLELRGMDIRRVRP